MYHKIAEQSLGRRLASWEVVHHRNSDCADNRLENLEVMSNIAHGLLHGKEARIRAKVHKAQLDFKLQVLDTDPTQILWSRLVHLDLSEIAR